VRIERQEAGMPRLRQPLLGIVATALVVVASLAVISLFSWPTFSGWVAYGMMCAIPVTIVVGVVSRGELPAGVARFGQPVRGLLQLAMTAGVAVVVGAVHFLTIGGGVDPPVPMLVQAIIVSVNVAFWLAVVWGGWPFVLIKNRLVSAGCLLVAVYAVNAALFRFFFDYDFLRGAPVYHADLDPHGAFNGWDATVFAVTCLSVMFLLLHLDLWPLTRVPAVMRQPVLGAVWTAIVLLGGAALFLFGTRVLGMTAPVFLVRVPIPFIFGSVVLINMLQGSLFAGHRQPRRGVLGALTAAVAGALLAAGYALLMPAVTGPLVSGAPANDAEVWLADALLAVTFPFLAFYADYFTLWPLAARNQPDTPEQSDNPDQSDQASSGAVT
jgi:hypothetical protein